MKQFEPFDKVLIRIDEVFKTWTPAFYARPIGMFHFIIGCGAIIADKDILPYKGNEHLIGTTNEPIKGTRIRIVYKPAENMNDKIIKVTDVNAAIKDLSNDKNVAYYIVYNDLSRFK